MNNEECEHTKDGSICGKCYYVRARSYYLFGSYFTIEEIKEATTEGNLWERLNRDITAHEATKFDRIEQ